MHSLADRSSNELHRFARNEIQDGGPFSRRQKTSRKISKVGVRANRCTMQWIGLNIIMRRNETCRAPRYTLRSSLNRPSWPPLLRVSPRSKKLRPSLVKPKSRKFGPFPTVPPSTTPRGMHFSYPRDIIAPVGCINRFGKGNNEGKTSRRYEVNSKRIM